jgi:hypothetical protein
MTWVKLDASYFFDPKVERLSPLAELLFVRGLCHAKAHLTDGIISRRALAAIAPEDYDEDGDRIAPERLVAELVGTGLWAEVRDEGATRVTAWVVTAWHAHNDPAERVKAKRVAEVERVKAWREGKKKTAPKDIAPGQAPVDDEALRAYQNRSLRDSETETETETETEKTLSLADGERTTKRRGSSSRSSERERSVEEAVAELAARDLRRATSVRNPRAFREAAIKARRRDHAADLHRIAHERPTATAQELADAIEASQELPAEHGAQRGPCELCGLEWTDPTHAREHAERLAGVPKLGVIAGGRS